MSDLAPFWLASFFALTTFLCLYLGFKILKSSSVTSKYAFKICGFMLLWLLAQAILTINKVYDSPKDFPPKIVLLGVLPIFLVFILLFALPKTRNAIESFSLPSLAYINLVRVPVEIALYFLFVSKMVPELMTFEGRNFDILSGLTAPIMVYFFAKGMDKKLFLVWHLCCLALLVNIVWLALFSAQTPFQKFAFEQPNVAIVHFPYSWLPTFIVPMVLFGHLSSILILLKQRSSNG